MLYVTVFIATKLILKDAITGFSIGETTNHGTYFDKYKFNSSKVKIIDSSIKLPMIIDYFTVILNI